MKTVARVWQSALMAVCLAAVVGCGDSSAGAKIQDLPSEIVLNLPGDVTLEMVKINAGSFLMGSPESEQMRDDDEAPHRVTLTRDYCLGKFEVTQTQWKAVMGNNPSRFKRGNRPVEYVSWDDAMEFCAKLNEMGKAPAGYKFTLPTEAQWEYAARGGKESRGYKYSGSNTAGDVAWFGNIGDETHPVAMKKANELGLYDMSGNVWEWCLDWYEKGYAANPETLDGNTGKNRVSKGGGWETPARTCRPAHRGSNDRDIQVSFVGFRLALVPERQH